MIITMTAEDVIKKYLGSPYKHKGRDPKTGLDCWGLGVCIFKDLGITLLDFDIDYNENWCFSEGNHFIENYWKQWEKVEQPKLFDCVLFKFYEDGHPNHGGICLGQDRFIHACKTGVVVGNLTRPAIQNLTVGFFRHKEML